MVMVSMAAVILVAAAVLFLLLSPVRVRVLYRRRESRSRTIVEVRWLWGMVHKRWVWRGGAGVPDSGRGIASWRDPEGRPDLVPEVAGWWRLWRRHRNLRRSVQRFLRRVTIRKWHTDLRFGTGDAVLTGVLAGIFWSFFYGFAAALGTRVRLCRPVARVRPVFDLRIVEIDVDSIAQFRVGQAIGAGVSLAIALWKEGLLWRSTRSRV
ncbi:MAG: DUF2953 domain-containing protein [Alicyclobacillaceae bacterium]|nr:DUF2953 domain-containing protein [Alicyclobacillaceae bacterium]